MENKIDIEPIIDLAIKAGLVILDIYQNHFSISYKEDKSPLTQADVLANEIICHGLQQAYPHIPILSEENQLVDYEIRKNWSQYWCIDPLDGTKEFIEKNGEFTVNIALIEQGRPVLGVVYAPVLQTLYAAREKQGAYKNGQPLPLKQNTSDAVLKVVASRSHLNQETKAYIEQLTSKKVQLVTQGSSLKLCMVASGEADIYPRLGPTMEWDTAAADAIVREAGKMTYDFDTGQPLRYNKENLKNPWFIVR